jgi:hypothetical protein
MKISLLGMAQFSTKFVDLEQLVLANNGNIMD